MVPEKLTTRTRDRRLNREIVSSIKKGRRGTGLRLLAPCEPTAEELQETKQKLQTLQESLREKLEDVNEVLAEEEAKANKKFVLESKYAKLARELDRLEEDQMIERSNEQPHMSMLISKSAVLRGNAR